MVVVNSIAITALSASFVSRMKMNFKPAYSSAIAFFLCKDGSQYISHKKNRSINDFLCVSVNEAAW